DGCRNVRIGAQVAGLVEVLRGRAYPGVFAFQRLGPRRTRMCNCAPGRQLKSPAGGGDRPNAAILHEAPLRLLTRRRAGLFRARAAFRDPWPVPSLSAIGLSVRARPGTEEGAVPQTRSKPERTRWQS